MTTLTTKLTLATALVALASTSGCQLLFRAAKGELTPIGVEQATTNDLARMAGYVSDETDPTKFAKAFSGLASVYMYKCMDNPSLVPSNGSSEIRMDAGSRLLGAMQTRVAKWGAEDPVLAGASAEISALPGKLGKCDEAKRSTQDAGGKFAQALAIATPDGRAEHVNTLAKGLDASLDQALNAGDDKVIDWVNDQCGQALPEWGYCRPRAAEGFWAKGRVDGLARTLLSYSDRSAALLTGLAAKVGSEALVAEIRKVMTSKDAVELDTTALENMMKFLRENGAWKTCDDGNGLVRSALSKSNTQLPRWAIFEIMEEGCRNFDDEIVKALASDDPWVREAAAVAVGELGIQKGKKHVDRLRTSDPYMDEGCWCRPVRDAAANAYNKLEIEAG